MLRKHVKEQSRRKEARFTIDDNHERSEGSAYDGEVPAPVSEVRMFALFNTVSVSDISVYVSGTKVMQ